MAHERVFDINSTVGVFAINVLHVESLRIAPGTNVVEVRLTNVSFSDATATDADGAQAQLSLWRTRVEDAR